MKRTLAALLILAMLLPLVLTGCGPDRGQGSVVCRQFIQYLAEQNFDAAYDLISPDLQKEDPPQPVKPTKGPTPGPGETAAPTAAPTATPLPTAEPTAEPADSTNHRMTRAEFKKRYTDIFDAMELTAITSQIVSEVNGTLNASVVYRMAYLTNKAGNLIFDFTVSSEYHEGWVVMWDPSLIFPNMEWGDTMLVGTNYPDRGEIFDAEGILLAENVPAVTIYCIPSKIQLKDGGKAVTDVKTLFKAEDKQLTPDQLLEKELYVPFEQAVAAVPELELTEADVRNSLARTFRDFAKLKVLYPDEMNPELEARLLAIPGVGVDSNNYGTLRQYPYGTSLAHLLGYAGIIQKEYLNHYSMENGILKENKEWLYVLDENGNKVNDPNYDGDSWLGYAGLEKQYEEKLRGVKGSFAYIQGKGGQVKQILYNVPAVDGEDLHLSVKINLQKRTEEVIQNIVYDDAISGTVIVMNPTTGAVEAMVSFPGYDPNSFTRGDLDDEAWAAMEKDPKTPLLNRAIQGLYPPGSTFKPLVAITGLESGNMTLDWAFPEEQEHLRGIDTIWNPTKGTLIPESGVTKVTRTYSTNRRGPMNMKNCMIQSDNIYFAYLGMKIGWDTLKRYLTVMGMGEAIPFDLPTQKSQIKNTGDGEKEASEETMDLLAMTGYGQGELLLTPLQLLRDRVRLAGGQDRVQRGLPPRAHHLEGDLRHRHGRIHPGHAGGGRGGAQHHGQEPGDPRALGRLRHGPVFEHPSDLHLRRQDGHRRVGEKAERQGRGQGAGLVRGLPQPPYRRHRAGPRRGAAGAGHAGDRHDQAGGRVDPDEVFDRPGPAEGRQPDGVAHLRHLHRGGHGDHRRRFQQRRGRAQRRLRAA